jgi:hypothetical protein
MQSYKNTFWDHTPARCRVVTITVADLRQFIFYWARPYVGQQRQALEVQTANQIFYIDNEGGQGIQKVNLGAHMGKPHRSLMPEPYTAITEVPDQEVIYPTPELLKAAEEKIEADCTALYGREYLIQLHAAAKKTLAAMRATGGRVDFSGDNRGKVNNE